MKNQLLYIVLLLATSFGKAHQADVASTLVVEKDNGDWVLQIHASLTAFEQEIAYNFPENSYSTPEEFKALVLRYMKKNITLQAHQVLELENGFVKLGHETHVIFKIVNMPKDIATLQIRNSAFQDIPNNQNGLIILKKGFQKKRFILTNENEHQVALKVGDDRFELISENTTFAWLPLAMILGALVVIIGVSITYMTYFKPTSTFALER